MQDGNFFQIEGQYQPRGIEKLLIIAPGQIYRIWPGAKIHGSIAIWPSQQNFSFLSAKRAAKLFSQKWIEQCH